MLSDGHDVSSRWQRQSHGPRQQFVDAVDRMVSNALEHVGEIRLGIEAIQACRADQAIHRGGTFATEVGAGEQVIPSAEGDAAQCSLGDQVVDFRTPVAAVVDERRPAIQRVLNRLGRVGFCRERGERCFEPAFHVVEQRYRSRLAHTVSLIRWFATDLLLDLVERADPVQRFLRYRIGTDGM